MKKLSSSLPLPVKIFLATAWIGASEFTRNEILLKDFWVNHYKQLGTTFPDTLINGAIWGIWSLLFAIFIYTLSRKHTLKETALISWFGVFVLMWVVIGNLNVLPYAILPFAIPLSFLECYVAAAILKLKS